MPDKRKIIYWDACVFLSYINEYPGRVATLESVLHLHRSSSDSTTVYTSTLSHVEVSFGASEQQNNALDPQTEQRIDRLWKGSGSVNSVEFHQVIAQTAKALIRQAISHGWSLKPADAVHLATAKWLTNTRLPVAEFHTYDSGLKKYEKIVGFDIVEPHTDKPMMSLTS